MKTLSALRQAAQKVVDERFKPGGEWEDLKNSITDLANVLDQKPSHDAINCGGPAFPSAVLFDQAIVEKDGMTLRDWFAGMAMQGMLSNPDFNGASDASVAGFAFRQADAMIEGRERKEDA